MDRTGGYYDALLRDFQGVNLGYQLLPTVFNMVMDAVVRNWVSLVDEGVAEPDGGGR